MQKLEIRGHQVEIYKGYNGDEVFIEKNGKRIYSARTNKGEGLKRARQIILKGN